MVDYCNATMQICTVMTLANFIGVKRMEISTCPGKAVTEPNSKFLTQAEFSTQDTDCDHESHRNKTLGKIYYASGLHFPLFTFILHLCNFVDSSKLLMLC